MKKRESDFIKETSITVVNNLRSDGLITSEIVKVLKEALNIYGVGVPKGGQCAHNNEPILDKNGHYECPDCKRYGENC